MSKVVYAKDLGFAQNGEASVSKSLSKLLSTLDKSGSTLVLEKGIYHFHYDDCAESPFYITNTAPEHDVSDITRKIGVFFDHLENIVLDGNGSQFLIHGEMSALVFSECRNVTIKNLSIDYVRPTVREMTVSAVGINYVDVKINADCPYKIMHGKLVWHNMPSDYIADSMQLCRKQKGITHRIIPFLKYCRVSLLEGGAVRCFTSVPKSLGVEIGDVFQARKRTRTEVGVLIDNSDGVNFENLKIHYMHGLGIVGQTSGNLSFDRIICAPNPDSNRTTACFADFMHFSTCHGKISVTNSHFDGAHDDVINVHGGYLMITKKVDEKTLIVRFPHKDTYGFDAFKCGDLVEFVKKSTLGAVGTERICNVEKLNPREVKLSFTAPLGKDVKVGVGVENITRTAELYVDNCVFKNIPTRGILATTRKSVVITNNVFDKTGMSGILISDDMGLWYESGRVADVKIEGNTFLGCGHANGWAAILIKPENLIAKKNRPVHRNIVVRNNVFELDKTTAVYAKSTEQLKIYGNTFKGATGRAPLFKFLASTKVSIADNEIQTANRAVKSRKIKVECKK